MTASKYGIETTIAPTAALAGQVPVSDGSGGVIWQYPSSTASLGFIGDDTNGLLADLVEWWQPGHLKPVGGPGYGSLGNMPFDNTSLTPNGSVETYLSNSPVSLTSQWSGTGTERIKVGQMSGATANPLRPAGDVDFSFVGWFRLDSGFGSLPRAIFANEKADPNRGFSIIISPSPTLLLTAGLSSDGTDTNKTILEIGENGLVTAGNEVTINKWYFYMFTYDSVGDVMSLYLGHEGTLYGPVTTAHAGGVFNFNEEMTFGYRHTGGADFFWKGQLGGQGYWRNRILTTANASFLYNNGNGIRFLSP